MPFLLESLTKQGKIEHNRKTTTGLNSLIGADK